MMHGQKNIKLKCTSTIP